MKIIAKTIYTKGYYLEWSTEFMDKWEGTEAIPGQQPNDIQVNLKTKKGKYLADAICHYGSYGVEDNLWEIMSAHPPKSWGDSVKGHLTWKEVMKYFDREVKLNEN